MATRESRLADLDFDAIASSADLLAILQAEGIEVRNGKALCPHHDDRRPSLSIFQHQGRWMIKCHSGQCGFHGDAITWVSVRDGIDLAAAARQLAGIDGTGVTPRKRPAPPPKPSPSKSAAWEDPAWQAVAGEIVRRAEAALWGPGGREALDWLRARKLTEATIRRFRLGFLAASLSSERLDILADADGPRPIWAPRGIVFPWAAPGSCYEDDPVDPPRFVGLQVRRLADNPFSPLPEGMEKCLAVRGSSRGYAYPFADVQPTEGDISALVLEGEFDALLGWQESGWLAQSITVGASSQPPNPTALLALARSPTWLIGMDHDLAGNTAAAEWRRRAPEKARRVLLPVGKDLTEFAKSGGNVAAWVAAELARVALPADADEGPDDWRWRAANLPRARWLEWVRLTDELRPAGAGVAAIDASERLAYEQVAVLAESPL